MKRFSQIIVEDRIEPGSFNLQSMYDEINFKIWKGELPKVPLSFKKTPKGLTAFCSGKSLNGKLVPDSAFIQIDPRKFEYDKLKGLLAHEMIHLEFFLRDNFKEGHGLGFESRRIAYSHRLGLEIPKTDNLFDADEYEEVTQQVGYLVFYFEGRKPTVALISPKLAEQHQVALRVVADFLIKKDSLAFGGRMTHAKLVIGSSPLSRKNPVSRTIDPMRIDKAKFYATDENIVSSIKVSKVLFSV